LKGGEMFKKDFDFWEKELTDYDNQVISVFSSENVLTRELNNIKDKKSKTVADYGCGVGNSFRFLTEFKRAYAIDFSENMLKRAEEKKTDNIILILDNMKTVKLPEKTDIGLAVSSIMPKSIQEFYEIVDNILANTKDDGELFFVVPSFESRVLYYILYADYMQKEGMETNRIYKKIIEAEINENFNSFGYFLSKGMLVQKHWLKEEILMRLCRYGFKSIEIEKLELDWAKQIKLKEYENYPKLWFWFLKINFR